MRRCTLRREASHSSATQLGGDGGRTIAATKSLPALASATAAATAATAAATATARAFLGFIDSELPPVEIDAVHCADRAFGLAARAHGHESKATRLTGHTIGHEVNIDHIAVGGKGIAQRLLGGMKRKIANVQTISHFLGVSR
jgi:hypothetical protein